jgi:hypothetical protein
MNLSRIEQLRDELLQNRRLAITAGLVFVGFWIVTLIGGYFLLRHALDDGHVATRSLNIPTQVGLLFDTSASDTLNHIVYFNDVKIEPGPTDDLYFAVGANGHRVLVVATGSKTPTDADAVDIQGTVRTVPPMTTLTRKWKLTKEDAERVKRQGIYIEADQIKPDRNGAAQRLAARK